MSYRRTIFILIGLISCYQIYKNIIRKKKNKILYLFKKKKFLGTYFGNITKNPSYCLIFRFIYILTSQPNPTQPKPIS